VVTSPPGRAGSARPSVDAGRLWAGGAATAVVAALVAVVGVLIGETLLDLTMVEPPLLPIGDSLMVRFGLTAAVLALVATGIAHALALSAPRPRAFFGWIVGLGTLVGVVLPFAEDGTLGGQVATAAVDLAIGLCVLNLLSSVLARTVTVAGQAPRTAPPPTWQ
jgi:hypothetical protein